MHKVDDDELVSQVSTAVTDEMSELYRQHCGQALRYATSLTRCPDAAEDLVAEGFARMWSRMKSGTRPAIFIAYLTITIRNLHLDQVRRRRPVDSLEEVSFRALADPALTVTDHAGACVERALLERAWADLTETHQQALTLTLVEGYDNTTVARRLGISLDAVSSLTWRARRALRMAYTIQASS